MIGSLLALLLVSTPAHPSDEPRQAEQAGDPREEQICRRRVVPAERVGERFRTVRVCKTREEWEESRERR